MSCMDVLDRQPESEAEAFSLLAYEEIMAEPTAESEITTVAPVTEEVEKEAAAENPQPEIK